MQLTRTRLAVAALVLGGFSNGAAYAAVTVTVSEMHLCCRACTMAVEKAVAGMDGVKAVVTADDGTTKVDAPDAKTAQAALDAIAKAGFVGKVDSEEVKFGDIKTPEGKVKRLEVFQVHNCCPACTKAIKGALAEVEGVVADTCKSKETSFVIEGDFSAKDAIAALSKAGFYCSIEKPEPKPAE
jgi:mercuric ion binding protein